MISIVICTKGERANLLQRSIASINGQYEATEVLIETGSPKRSGLSAARNDGLAEARGEYVAFIDDDAELSPDWSSALVQAFRNNPEAAGITGPIIPSFELEEDRKNYPESLYWIVGCTPPLDFSPYGHGANMAFRRDRIEGLRFDERYGSLSETRGAILGEDVEFQLRAGKMAFAPGVSVFHYVPHSRCSPSYARRYAFGQGRTEIRYRAKGTVPERPGKVVDIVFSWRRPLLRAEVLIWAAAGAMREVLF